MLRHLKPRPERRAHEQRLLRRDKEPKWNLPRENGGWDVDWKHELATQRRRAQLEKDDDDDDKGDGEDERGDGGTQLEVQNESSDGVERESITAPSPNNKMNESILSGGNKPPSPANQKSISPNAGGGASPAASLNMSVEKEDMDVDVNKSQGWFTF